MIIYDMSIEYIVLYLLANSIRIYAVSRYMNLFYDRSEVNRRTEIVWYLAYFIVNSLGNLLVHSLTLNIASNVIPCLCISYLYPSKPSRKLVITGMVYGINIGWDSVIGAAFFPTDNYLITTGLLTSICVLFTGYVIKRFIKMRSDLELPHKGKMLFIIPVVSVILALLNYSMHSFTPLMIVNLIGFLVIDFSVFIVYDYLLQANQEAYNKKLIYEQNVSYRYQHALMQESLNQLRQFRHDLKMHTTAIQLMLQDGRGEDALDYINAATESIKPMYQMISTGNHSIDCILNYKLARADEENIDIQTTIVISERLGVSAYDLNIIISNLLDNAIEAVRCCNHKMIKFVMRSDSNMLFISIENPYTGEVNMEGSRFITRKKDSINHGFGIDNVRTVVEKYDGSIEFSFHDNTFMVSLFLLQRNQFLR